MKHKSSRMALVILLAVLMVMQAAALVGCARRRPPLVVSTDTDTTFETVGKTTNTESDLETSDVSAETESGEAENDGTVDLSTANGSEDTKPNTADTTEITEVIETTEVIEPETEETKAPSGNNDTSSGENDLPSFVVPVIGKIFKRHDPTLSVYSNTTKDYRIHIGIDISTESHAPVYAVAEGTVARIWEDNGMGNCISIKHTGDCYTIYKNLDGHLPENITVGASVRAGQLIAVVGASAMLEVADEPHLHFEMTVDGQSVNPLKYLNESYFL